MGEYRLAESQVLAQTAVRRRAQQREQYRKILLVLQANPRHLGVVGVPAPWITSALKELPHLVLSPGALKSAQACRSSNVRLVWTRLAHSDRKSIRDYIARDPAAALAMGELFAQKAASLANSLDLGRPGRVTGTREMVAHKIYILAYDVAGDCVRVLRVLHAARQWPPVRKLLSPKLPIQRRGRYSHFARSARGKCCRRCIAQRR